MKPIAHIHTDFPEKFGIPRQSNLVSSLQGTIVFEPEYRNPDALRGMEDYDYIWLIWEFQIPEQSTFQATVRPPRLGGNTHMGVFATRSPFRPNPIGLSSVRLDRVEFTAEGPILHVSGIDMKDGTPIYDIKPYLPYVDSHPDARGGFAHRHNDHLLQIKIPEQYLQMLTPQQQESVIGMLAQDPRPSYQNDPDRIYGITFGSYNIQFQVVEDLVTVTNMENTYGK